MALTLDPPVARPRPRRLDVPRAAPGRALDRLPRPASPAPRWSRFDLVLRASLVVGALLRLAAAMTDDAPSTDETAYLRSGLSLVGGEGFVRDGRPELHFPPLIPFLSGLSNEVVGDPHEAKVALTLAASILLIIPLALIARRVGGDRAGIAVAWVAAIGGALSTTVVNRGAGSEAEYLLFVVGATWFAVDAAGSSGRGLLLRLAAGGTLVGFSYLTRPEALTLALPIGVGVLALAWRRRSRPGQAVTLLLAFGLPVLACVAPYVAYLHANTGRWELSAKSQDVSIEAWHAIARGDRESRDAVLYALDESGYEMANTERTALSQLARDDPSGYAAIVRTNFGQLGSLHLRPESDRMLTWLLVPAPLFPLAVWGVVAHRRSRALWVLGGTALMAIITGLAFFLQVRYLFVPAAVVTVLVGLGLAAIERRWLRILAGLAVATLLLTSTVQAFLGPGGWGHPADHSDHRAAGVWIAANSQPGDRVMTRSMVAEFYQGRRAMAIPYAPMDQILEYARHYEVRFLILDWYTARRLRPQLQPLRSDPDAVPGLQLVYQVRREGRTTQVFEFDAAAEVTEPSAPMGATLGFVGDG